MRRLTALAALAILVVGIAFALGVRASRDGTDAKAQPARHTQISWTAAQTLITGCRVREVGQTHALAVTLTLRNGARRFAREPAIDDVMRVLNRARRCGPVTFATE
jgi:hypothetical protein